MDMYPNVFLDSMELELFSHYLMHTSRIIPLDAEDLYALQVGIPNLAFRSKPLMSSILALAAICKSHDMLKRPRTTVEDRREIHDLLVFADQHHRTSLLQVQADLPNLNQYDYVLANAALMVLYATSSHCLRIRLAETQPDNEPLLREFILAQTQWISLIRAAHLAFTGLLNDDTKTVGIRQESIEPPLAFTCPNGNIQTAFDILNISPDDGPSERTKNLLFPIIAASSGPAFEALRKKAHAFRAVENMKLSPTQSNSSSNLLDRSDRYDAGLNACFESLDILVGIATELFSTKGSFSSVASHASQSQSKLDFPSSGRLSTVPMWLKSYLARVTSSATTPRPLRRVIMAFLNRVPAEYLNLVQTILDSISMQTSDSSQEPWGCQGLSLSDSSPVHKLAIDIFAHWVVLVMLLDGVWWIGGIGAWELGRIVSFMRGQGWVDSTIDTGEYWWPESIYKVERELKNLVNPR
ncbi:hypothetical protein B7463_g5893, partial [Scytalidium lignicola]